jgi:hypothetical protein
MSVTWLQFGHWNPHMFSTTPSTLHPAFSQKLISWGRHEREIGSFFRNLREVQGERGR